MDLSWTDTAFCEEGPCALLRVGDGEEGRVPVTALTTQEGEGFVPSSARGSELRVA